MQSFDTGRMIVQPPRTMVLGISSFTYGWAIGVPGHLPSKRMDARDLVNKAVTYGLSCLQIGDNLPLHELTVSTLDELKALGLKHNLRLELGARKLTPEHLRRYISLAIHFEAPLLRFVIDGDDYEPDIATVVNIIREVLPELERYHITLGIENHDRFKARELADMINTINHNRVGICLDCVNSLGAGEGLEWVSSMLAPYTVNLHIKDFIIKRHDHKMGFTVTGTEPGKGMLNTPELIKKLKGYNRCESAVLEQWIAPESTIEDTIKKEARWADTGIQYLKTVSL